MLGIISDFCQRIMERQINTERFFEFGRNHLYYHQARHHLPTNNTTTSHDKLNIDQCEFTSNKSMPLLQCYHNNSELLVD